MDAGKKPEGMDPRAKKEFVADFDYEFDEKHKTVVVTEQGVAKAERFLGIDHLYRAENGPLVNHLIQSLKAESLYKRDVDYAVIDGEVKIIDEFTGRILEGRRWSEGLHQAVEAKEGVRVQEENQTLATITLQNYFRMYDKLAGHDRHGADRGDRVHEDLRARRRPGPDEPADGPRRPATTRSTRPRTASGTAVVREIAARHENGQPVLVGTISVEVSELLGERLRQRGIPHTVLNAKPEHAEREGEIVAEAGRPARSRSPPTWPAAASTSSSAATPSTSTQLELAKLGLEPGDPDYDEQLRRGAADDRDARSRSDREKVVEAGGLFICGTERHESRRIDNQLRGRSGRQGDPGESRFFLSRRGRPRAPVRRRPHLQDPRPPRRRPTTRATRSRSRPGSSPSRSRRPSARSRSRTS